MVLILWVLQSSLFPLRGTYDIKNCWPVIGCFPVSISGMSRSSDESFSTAGIMAQYTRISTQGFGMNKESMGELIYKFTDGLVAWRRFEIMGGHDKSVAQNSEPKRTSYLAKSTHSTSPVKFPDSHLSLWNDYALIALIISQWTHQGPGIELQTAIALGFTRTHTTRFTNVCSKQCRHLNTSIAPWIGCSNLPEKERVDMFKRSLLPNLPNIWCRVGFRVDDDACGRESRELLSLYKHD